MKSQSAKKQPLTNSMTPNKLSKAQDLALDLALTSLLKKTIALFSEHKQRQQVEDELALYISQTKDQITKIVYGK